MPVSVLAVMLCILFSSFKSRQAAIDPLSGWDKEILKQANTADTVSYLSPEEKKLIFYTNLCRLKPKLFCQTVLEDYLAMHPDSSNESDVSNLKNELNEDRACNALIPDSELCTMAHDYAKKLGEEGLKGHIDFDARFEHIMERFNHAGENCDYQDSTAIDAFMKLLIDSRVPGYGHRESLMDGKFTSIGVSLQPHIKYKWTFVMEFAGKKVEE